MHYKQNIALILKTFLNHTTKQHTKSQKEIKKETMQNLFKRRKRWANVSGLSLKMKTWTQKPHIMVA